MSNSECAPQRNGPPVPLWCGNPISTSPLRADYLRQLPPVEDAFGRQALALPRQLNAACTNADELASAVTEHFDTHPDAPIITSQPSLGALTGARILAEIGDDRSRFSDAKALKAYAGSTPVTRASGKSLAVMHRRVKNQRLAATGYLWAFAALTVPAACHVTEQYANNPIESDHGRLKSRLRPMRGLKRLRSTRVICAGHAFVHNLRRGHYELGLDLDPRHRLPAVSSELALAI